MLLYTLARGHLTRGDESCLSEGTSPGGCRRLEEQAATRSLQCQEGWAGQAGVGTCSPQPLPGPHGDFTMLLLSLPQDLINTLPPGLSLPAQPHTACIGSGKKNPGERGRFFTCAEVKSGPKSLPALPGSVYKARNQQTGSWW